MELTHYTSYIQHIFVFIFYSMYFIVSVIFSLEQLFGIAKYLVGGEYRFVTTSRGEVTARPVTVGVADQISSQSMSEDATM